MFLLFSSARHRVFGAFFTRPRDRVRCFNDRGARTVARLFPFNFPKNNCARRPFEPYSFPLRHMHNIVSDSTGRAGQLFVTDNGFEHVSSTCAHRPCCALHPYSMKCTCTTYAVPGRCWRNPTNQWWNQDWLSEGGLWIWKNETFSASVW
jgi:hypothetical protein